MFAVPGAITPETADISPGLRAGNRHSGHARNAARQRQAAIVLAARPPPRGSTGAAGRRPPFRQGHADDHAQVVHLDGPHLIAVKRLGPVRILVYEDKAPAILDNRAKSVRIVGHGDTPAVNLESPRAAHAPTARNRDKFGGDVAAEFHRVARRYSQPIRLGRLRELLSDSRRRTGAVVIPAGAYFLPGRRLDPLLTAAMDWDFHVGMYASCPAISRLSKQAR